MCFIVRHDLWGEAIVLATRYEGLRKSLFKHLKLEPSNILILQEAVFQDLPNEKKEKFVELDLKKAKIRVRDDEAATKLAFRGVEYGHKLPSSTKKKAG